MKFKLSSIYDILFGIQKRIQKFFFDLKHPKRVIYTQGSPHHQRYWDYKPNRHKEDPHTKKLRKMAERSRRINRKK